MKMKKMHGNTVNIKNQKIQKTFKYINKYIKKEK